jgi:hypothetical protein
MHTQTGISMFNGHTCLEFWGFTLSPGLSVLPRSCDEFWELEPKYLLFLLIAIAATL